MACLNVYLPTSSTHLRLFQKTREFSDDGFCYTDWRNDDAQSFEISNNYNSKKKDVCSIVRKSKKPVLNRSKSIIDLFVYNNKNNMNNLNMFNKSLKQDKVTFLKKLSIFQTFVPVRFKPDSFYTVFNCLLRFCRVLYNFRINSQMW